MVRRATFDVYGRFSVRAEQSEEGDWLFYRLGADGKRRRIFDVVVDRDAPLEEIERQLEAAYHEWGRPGTSITLTDDHIRP